MVKADLGDKTAFEQNFLDRASIMARDEGWERAWNITETKQLEGGMVWSVRWYGGGDLGGP